MKWQEGRQKERGWGRRDKERKSRGEQSLGYRATASKVTFPRGKCKLFEGRTEENPIIGGWVRGTWATAKKLEGEEIWE